MTMMNVTNGYPERIIPDEESPGIVALHLKRYDFAREQLRGKLVLDVACGVGYGTAYLAASASKVVGVDLAPEAIEYAQRRYGQSGIVEFYCEDATRLHFDDGSFDAVCSFETIEHVLEVDRFLSEVERVLRPGGVFFVSTPAAKVTTQSPSNPHHLREWSPVDFQALLSRYFAHVTLYSQMPRTTRPASLARRLDLFQARALIPLRIRRVFARIIGIHTTADLTLADVLIVEGLHSMANEIVAICR